METTDYDFLNERFPDLREKTIKIPESVYSRREIEDIAAFIVPAFGDHPVRLTYAAGFLKIFTSRKVSDFIAALQPGMPVTDVFHDRYTVISPSPEYCCGVLCLRVARDGRDVGLYTINGFIF